MYRPDYGMYYPESKTKRGQAIMEDRTPQLLMLLLYERMLFSTHPVAFAHGEKYSSKNEIKGWLNLTVEYDPADHGICAMCRQIHPSTGALAQPTGWCCPSCT